MKWLRDLVSGKGPITPMNYVMIVINIGIGLMFLTGIFVGDGESVLYSAGVLVERHLWGGLLLVSSSFSFYGMAADKTSFIRLSGLTGFLLWMFASLSLALDGYWYIFITVGMLHTLFHIHLYLSVVTDTLFRRG